MVEQPKLIRESISGTQESVPAILHFPLHKSFGAVSNKTKYNSSRIEHKTASVLNKLVYNRF